MNVAFCQNETIIVYAFNWNWNLTPTLSVRSVWCVFTLHPQSIHIYISSTLQIDRLKMIFCLTRIDFGLGRMMAVILVKMMTVIRCRDRLNSGGFRNLGSLRRRFSDKRSSLTPSKNILTLVFQNTKQKTQHCAASWKMCFVDYNIVKPLRKDQLSFVFSNSRSNYYSPSLKSLLWNVNRCARGKIEPFYVFSNNSIDRVLIW